MKNNIGIGFILQKENGFSLLEVMVAVVIMAMGIVPLLVTHAASIRNFTHSKELTHSTLLAESQLALVEAQGFQKADSTSGEDEQHPYLSYQTVVTPISEDVMIKTEVRVTQSPGEEDRGKRQRGDVDLVSYLVNLKFEKEEEEGTEKEK